MQKVQKQMVNLHKCTFLFLFSACTVKTLTLRLVFTFGLLGITDNCFVGYSYINIRS